jgi:hypothetical protein
MKKVAVVEDSYVRDSQIYTGDPESIDVDPDWENYFVDVRYPRQFIGIFEGETENEILCKAAEQGGIHPGVITLINIDGA